ncbi:MAG: hypothetical protein ABI367_00490 [Mucilaginibacter sp.]
MKTILFILQLSIVGATCFAQTGSGPNITIAITGRGYSDHIVLRYAPATPILFNKANIVGYVVEKAVYKDGIPFNALVYTPLKGSPFKRWSDEQWDKALENTDPRDSTNTNLVGLAATFSDPGGVAGSDDILKDGLKSLKDQKDKADMRFGFALIAANRNKTAASGLALSVTDNDVVQGQTYVYRVHINQPLQDAGKETAFAKVKCANFNEKYLRNDKAIKLNEGDGKISFSFPSSREYYAFTVQRSDDNGATYIRLSKLPKLNSASNGDNKMGFSYSDTGLVNYKKYFYRVFVSTPYADELPLAEFTGIPKDKTPPLTPFLRSADNISPKQVKLTWEMNGEKGGDLKGFYVKRSNKEDGKYNLISKEILPATARNYIDGGFDTEGNNYYVVEAIDTAGNVSSSFPAYVTLIDSIPPAVPVIALARIDTAGKILIKVKPNVEKDFIGYQLLKANAADHEFSVVTETFRDSLGRATFTLKDSTTLNTLTKHIYYKVIAFDSHYNQSMPSKIIELKKRDTIPPVSPLITNFAVTDTTVVLDFANSPSEDAVSNILLKREAGKAKYDTVFINKNIGVTRFIDKKIIGGKEYEYAMIAKDDGGLLSKAIKSIIIKTLLNNRIPAPTIQGAYDGNIKKISLSILVDDKLKNKKLKVEIYKRPNTTSAWIAYKIIDFEKGKPFLDDVESGQQNTYYTVRLVDENKNNSNFSNELEVNSK